MAFYSLDPFGGLRGDLRIGLLGTAVLRSLGAKTVKPKDFMIGFNGEPRSRRMSVKEMQANLLTAARGRVRIAKRNGQEKHNRDS